jgi:hypothetical protein
MDGTTSTTTATTSTSSTGGAGTGGAAAGDFCDEVKTTSWSCTPINYHDPLVSFVAHSSLVFRGTVTALHATTPGIGVTDTSRTVVANVEAVLFDGGMLDLTGQAVTVELLAAPTMAVGYAGYFFTSTWTIGQSVGVTEVAHVDEGVYPTIESDVPGIESLLADVRLHDRMATASSVLVGTVTNITPLSSGPPTSEHDPLWAAATITVDCALRGANPTVARAAFATSNDVAWYESPKLTVGQMGVFLLQPKPDPPGIWGLPADIDYVVTDPLDVHPLGDRAKVANLVLCPPVY